MVIKLFEYHHTRVKAIYNYLKVQELGIAKPSINNSIFAQILVG